MFFVSAHTNRTPHHVATEKHPRATLFLLRFDKRSSIVPCRSVRGAYARTKYRSSARHARSLDPPNSGAWTQARLGHSERIHQVSSKVPQVQHGSLYPTLHRLERRGWIKAHWGASENDRRAKYYELTRSGRKQLEAEKSEWRKLTDAVAQVLETA
jgi:PadR family transcriptional regulator PadR